MPSAVALPALPPMPGRATVMSGLPEPPVHQPPEQFTAAEAGDEFARAKAEPLPRWSSAYTGGPRVYADLLPDASKRPTRPQATAPAVDPAAMRETYLPNPFLPSPVDGDPLIRTHTLLQRIDGGRLLLPLAMPELQPEVRACLVLIERELEARTAPVTPATDSE